MLASLYNKTLGSYLPSFYQMELNFPFPSGEYGYLQLDEKFLSSFIHEYIHFLQDISTYTGYNNAYVYSEQVHGIVTDIYKCPPGDIKLPHHVPINYANIELNRFINAHSLGTYDKEENNVIVKRIRQRKIKVPIGNSPIKELTSIIIDHIGGKSLQFGSMAIMESMAYLIEKETTIGCSTPPDFPYCSAQLVCEQIYPEFGADRLRIIALCDMSLQFTEPGKVFVESLEMFKLNAFLPSNANDVVDYFYNNPCVQIDGQIKLIDGILTIGMTVGERLKTYLNDKGFSSFHNVVHTLFGYGMNQRINNRYFMLDIARNGYALNNPILMDAIQKVGTPIILDSNEDYWLVCPRSYLRENYRIDYFPAIHEVYMTLAKGYDACSLYPWCEKSENVDQDDRCVFKPWERAGDKYLCPYAMLWRHWNLTQYNPHTLN